MRRRTAKKCVQLVFLLDSMGAQGRRGGVAALPHPAGCPGAGSLDRALVAYLARRPFTRHAAEGEGASRTPADCDGYPGVVIQAYDRYSV